MGNIFPRWINRLPMIVGAGGALVALLGVGMVSYYFSPKFTDVGYRPVQPLPFSHKLHAGELEMDCRYCHANVEVAAAASVPPTQTCMNCHKLVARDSPQLELLRTSSETSMPLRWIRVHKLPDYAYFNHSIHLRAGVGCSSCHGDVASMEQVIQMAPLSMSWCLDCHRNPDPHLRRADELVNTTWAPPPDQAALAQTIRREKSIHPSTDCTACHR